LKKENLKFKKYYQMNSKDEIIFVVDSSNQPQEPKTRSFAIKNNLWRRVSGGILFDPLTLKVLCHKRSNKKDERKSRWVATFGGKVSANEDSIDCALRELKEEYGVDMLPNQLFYLTTYKSTERLQFEYVHLSCYNSKFDIDFQRDEIIECEWMNIVEVLNNLKSDPDWFSYGYDIDILSAILKPENTKKSTISDINETDLVCFINEMREQMESL